MAWYWTDDLVAALVRLDRLSVEASIGPTRAPQAVRRDEPTVEEAAVALQDDGGIPQVA